MSISLLKTLTKCYRLVDKASNFPATVVPSEHDFVLGPGDDLESMIWVLTYAIMLHHQESVQASDKSGYKCNAVDQFYGGLSHSALAKERDVMVFRGINPLADKPDGFPIRHNANGLGVR